MQLQESQNCEFIITFFNKEKTFMKSQKYYLKCLEFIHYGSIYKLILSFIITFDKKWLQY